MNFFTRFSKVLIELLGDAIVYLSNKQPLVSLLLSVCAKPNVSVDFSSQYRFLRRSC